MNKQQWVGYWASLQGRERQLLVVAGVTLVVAIFYFGLWQPLQQKLQMQQTELHKVQQQLLQVQSLPASSVKAAPSASLTDLLSSSARKHKIQVSRMQPQNNQMQVMLDDLNFDQLMSWLYELQYQHLVSIDQLDITNAEASGVVRVRRLVVERS